MRYLGIMKIIHYYDISVYSHQVNTNLYFLYVCEIVTISNLNICLWGEWIKILFTAPY